MERVELVQAIMKVLEEQKPQESIRVTVERLANIADLYRGETDGTGIVTLRGSLGNAAWNLGDSDKEIKVQISLYNTPQNRLLLASLGSASVDIVGTQADLTVRSFEPAPSKNPQTDIEEYCAAKDFKAQLEELLPNAGERTEFEERSGHEVWCLDRDMADIDNEDALLMGREAANIGRKIEDNPFTAERTEFHQPWQDGWEEITDLMAKLAAANAEEANAAAAEQNEWPGESTANVPPVSEWAGKTKAQLKQELKRRGVEVQAQASKEDLIKALEEAIAQAGPDAPAAESAQDAA